MNNYIKMIEEICNEENLEFKFLSKDWVCSIKKNNECRYIYGYKFDLNSLASSKIVDDKYALYEVLQNENIPIIEHNISFKSNNTLDYASGANNYKIVHDFYKHNNQHIVIKANEGTCGTEVFNITSEDEIDKILNNLFLNNRSISYCPFYDIENEYRVIILKGKVRLVYKKYKPCVIGNGVNSIKELLYKFNESYFKDKLVNDDYARVLLPNEVYEYDWRFNLSRGARASFVHDDMYENVSNVALKCLDALNLKFCSVDIIRTNSGKMYVMEINSGVMMKNIVNLIDDGYEIAKEIYRDAILEMFNKGE